jgi:hypothetical protein
MKPSQDSVPPDERKSQVTPGRIVVVHEFSLYLRAPESPSVGYEDIFYWLAKGERWHRSVVVPRDDIDRKFWGSGRLPRLEPDGDLPRGPVVADPLDDRLNRMHLEPAIQPRPGSGLGNPALCFPNLSEDRFLDAAAGSDLGGGEENTPGISARGNRTGDGVPVACHRRRI